MKVKALFAVISALLLTCSVHDASAQNERVTVNMENVSVKAVLDWISSQTDYAFFYSNAEIDDSRIVSVSAKNQTIQQILSQIIPDVTCQFDRMKIILGTARQASPARPSAPVQISGVVKDEEGEPLAGAAVIVEIGGKNLGCVADMDGKFSMTLPQAPSPKQSIVFSCLGFADVVETMNGRAFFDVTMQSDSQMLAETVVVGYDVQKKVNLTGAVASISSDAFSNRPVVQASTALQGAVAGVTVTTAGGAPGADTGTIRIRGIGTFGGGSSAPLVLIDGVEGSLDSVDATQIDQISVLKDAASSAIYGSRAANGVILITTKRGKDGVFGISYRGYAGWQRPTATPDTVNPVEYMILNREATENDGATSIYTDEYIENYMKNNWLDPDQFPVVEWKKHVLNGNGFTHNHNLTMTCSNGKMKMLTSFGYLDQNGIVKSAGFDRYSLRNNLNVDITDRLKFRLDISGSAGRRQISPDQGGMFMFMNARDPLFLAQWSDGSYAPFTGGTVNILPMCDNAEGGSQKSDTYRASLAAALTYSPWKWLTIEGTLAPRITFNHSKTFKDKVAYHSDQYGTVSPISNRDYNELTDENTTTIYGNYLLTVKYHQKFAAAHDLTFLAGTSYETMDQQSVSAFRRDYAWPEYQTINAGANNEYKDNSGARYQWALASFFGRLNYNYKERYLVEANVRFDGSSRFAKGHQWGIFPSVSAAWRITEENFMASVKDILSEMKIRASYGQLGNQNIGSDYYPTIQTLTISSISAADIIYPIVGLNNLANTDITWETTEMADAGIDLALWNKLKVTADAYYKRTTGVLMKLDIPSTIGLSSPYQNAGVVRNIGWELSVGYSDSFGDFSFGVDANVSDVYNKIVDMKGTASGSLLRNEEGYPINSIYGLRCIGMARSEEEADYVNANCPQYNTTTYPGDLIYEDVAGAFDENGNPVPDGQITDDDRQIIGSTIPRYTFGLSLNFGWKGLNLSAQFQGVGKMNAYINSFYTQPCVQGGTFRKEHLDRYTPETPDGHFPRLSYASEVSKKNSTFWMADAAYLRLKNLQLSYSLPTDILKKARIKGLTFFANATNLFTISRYYQGYDPENTFTSSSGSGATAGAVANNYPLVSTYTFGLDIKF